MNINDVFKDFDFSLKLIEDAYEKGTELSKIVDNRVKAVSATYLNNYLPNIVYEALVTLPVDGASYYSSPKGFLRNTVVDSSMLKLGASTTRQHYMGVTNAISGIEVDDIEAVVERLSEYIDINDSNIVAFASRSTLFKLKNTLAWEGNVDVFSRTGLPSETICGVQFIICDFMPKNKILFINGDADHIVSKLISPKADRKHFAA